MSYRVTYCEIPLNKNYVDSLFCGKNNVFQHRKEILKLNQSII
jgi:predicted nucleic acid binding AN1-type Zn finger protein